MTAKKKRRTSTHKVDRINSATRQMGRIARIHSAKVESLTDKRISVPAASAEGQIWLNSETLPAPTSRDAIATWLGVTMHEVGHIEWSPDPRSIGEDTRIWNILEDNRQENLMVAELPGTVAPLTRAVTDLILSTIGLRGRASSQWPLIAGRLYLPAKVRNAVYQATVAESGQSWTDAVREVIFDYMKLADPGYTDRPQAQALVVRMSALLNEKNVAPQHCGSTGSEAGRIGRIDDPESADTIEALSGSQDSENSEDAQGDQGDQGSEENGSEEESQDGSGSGAGDESKDDEESDDAGGGGGASDSGDDSGDGGSGEDDSEPAGDPGAGTGTGPAPDTHKARLDALDAMEGARAEATQELGDVIDIVLDQIRGDQPGTDTHNRHRVTKEARVAAARLLTKLKPLFDEAEAGLDRFTPKGRIRPDRMARGYRPDMSFDKWQVDMDEDVSAEIVVALDVSGSMGPHVQRLANAVWILRQVTERSAAKLTVVAWDTMAEVKRLKPLNNKWADEIYRGGGTSAAPMLKLAEAIFDGSQLDRKWLLIMTDGQISDQSKIAPYLERLKKAGVAITPIGFGTNARASVFGDNAKSIKQLAEIPDLIGKMLYDLYRTNAVR